MHLQIKICLNQNAKESIWQLSRETCPDTTYSWSPAHSGKMEHLPVPGIHVRMLCGTNDDAFHVSCLSPPAQTSAGDHEKAEVY